MLSLTYTNMVAITTMKPSGRSLLKVVDMSTFVLVDKDEMGYVGVINLFLEDGRTFSMYYIPLEIISALNKLESDEFQEEYVVRRESIFDLLPQLESFKELMGRVVKRVIIDTLDKETGLYSATVELSFDTITINKKMIPSHAIFLARTVGSPIYVHKDLLASEETLGE